jgi:RNA polymerase sigma factor (sigma-70 family)
MYIMQSGNIGEADADDIVQDIFVKLVDVLRAGGYKHEKGLFRNYLASMVRRLLIDRHRREMARAGIGRGPIPGDREAGSQAPTIDMDDLPCNTPDPATVVDMRLRLARHQSAVEHVLSRTMLDDRTVAAYREYAIEGHPAAEVAVRHGMTVNNLRQLKHRLDRMISAVEAELAD